MASVVVVVDVDNQQAALLRWRAMLLHQQEMEFAGLPGDVGVAITAIAFDFNHHLVVVAVVGVVGVDVVDVGRAIATM